MYTRRTMLKAGLATAAAAAAGAALPLGLANEAGAALRAPNSVPFPNLPVGKPTGAFPFQHLVLVMQENHSFDNYFGMLPRRGQPAADGFTFDTNGVPTNSNPLGPQHMVVFHEPDANGTTHTGSQGWNSTHLQINGGAMDGFAGTGPGSMGYYDESDLPFYYSLAKTFTLANRWFCSAPCQTSPNRRYYMAGTSSGIISTSLSNTNTAYPANGTIWDLLDQIQHQLAQLLQRRTHQRAHTADRHQAHHAPAPHRAVLPRLQARHAARGQPGRLQHGLDHRRARRDKCQDPAVRGGNQRRVPVDRRG